MEKQNHRKDLQFSPLRNDWISSNASGLISNFDGKQRYIMVPSSGVDLAPTSAHQWIHCQQTPQSYTQILAETEYSEIQKQMSYDISPQLPTLGLPNPSELEEYMRPHNGEDFLTTVTGLEQLGVQKQKWKEDSNHAFETCSLGGGAASKGPSKVNKKRSRERTCAAERFRRLRISYWLDALQELVPHPEGVGQAPFLDLVIDHVKHLQNQLKDLSRNRLGGESASNSIIFPEEHGHYYIQDEILNGPLVEMLEKFINIYPSAATELLQSRGLIVLPMTFAEGLLESMDMLHIQDKINEKHCPSGTANINSQRTNTKTDQGREIHPNTFP